MHTHISWLIVLLLPNKNYVLRKGHVETDDSYVEERGCPLFPLLLIFSQNHNRAPLLASKWPSPQNEQTKLCPSKSTISSAKILYSETVQKSCIPLPVDNRSSHALCTLFALRTSNRFLQFLNQTVFSVTSYLSRICTK